ncbi:ABC transporter ATP-binding protein [Meiothermus granaticius]|uniref:Oligopeptide transport ATP-binding protein OppF n=1 Tax=Meiothermus granaticius NBRC 107808 TaxID=1227551 RepID=A0A399F6M7_9DEIN|nr:oligopeptide/dipeptide ABC transporter ATP-binding protein [Meiothermus granaticius]MCL6525275.1 ATP-binding cassette domain-containing protein [Thermaceae bacterium]RIH91760.1 Oligopeptide transport ATP-binding protein OppF [Meiothermus granaticius NBRC 107808]GEM88116.1 ABC transporter ATP-binding protein [Meiothermus granaticius NBRC 107808]
MSQTILRVEGLSKVFPVSYSVVERVQGRPRRAVRALTEVNLEVRRGETLGIVGESGCGKSTLARCLVRLYDVDSGRIVYDGLEVSGLRGAALRQYNRRVQMVFQDPFSSLNPRMTVGQTLREAILVHRLRKPEQVPGRIRELLELVGLPADAENRLPHEFSGGQRQRIGIARALSVEPETLIADELVSALDVSVQAQVVNLLLKLQEQLHLTVLFVAHDLRLVRHLSHRVAVMYLGRIVELAETERLFTAPAHPYTQALLRAAPELDPSRKSVVEAVKGELPSPLNPPTGCPFHPRCPQAFERCSKEVPALLPRGPEGRWVACHLLEATP